eukprot:3193091-Amphidinium_carterae.1
MAPSWTESFSCTNNRQMCHRKSVIERLAQTSTSSILKWHPPVGTELKIDFKYNCGRNPHNSNS